MIMFLFQTAIIFQNNAFICPIQVTNPADQFKEDDFKEIPEKELPNLSEEEREAYIREFTRRTSPPTKGEFIELMKRWYGDHPALVEVPMSEITSYGKFIYFYEVLFYYIFYILSLCLTFLFWSGLYRNTGVAGERRAFQKFLETSFDRLQYWMLRYAKPVEVDKESSVSADEQRVPVDGNTRARVIKSKYIFLFLFTS